MRPTLWISASAGAVLVGLALSIPIAAQTEKPTIFTTTDFRQDRALWTDPAYYRNNTPGQLRGMTMVIVAGATSFLVGNAFQAQMPEYANYLGADETGTRYTVLLAADAAGAVIGVLLLETANFSTPTVYAAIASAGLWGVTMGLFPLTHSYPMAVILLVLAGAFNIAFQSISQTLVQMLAPSAIRGRVVGLFNMF